MIEKPGYYDAMSISQYLADPCPEPSLSTSTVQTLYERTPMRAHWEHTRLGGHNSQPTARADIGSAIHSLLLGGSPIKYVESVTRRSGKDKGESFIPTDWMTADAKEARDDIRASGGIPMLTHQREPIEQAALSAQKLLSSLGHGKSEQTMCFKSADVWMRGRADWLSDDGKYDVDVKTVDSADINSWSRGIISSGLDIQHGIRSLGHRSLANPRIHLWLLVEIEPPFECSFLEVSAEGLSQSFRKIHHAAKLWRSCLDSKIWPSYTGIKQWSPPQYVAWDMEERGIE